MTREPKQETYVIVGGGQAGAVAAATMRAAGFTGRILFIGAEQHLPYERPPLSKEVLVKPEQARLTIHPESFYAENGIETRFGVTALRLDAEEHTLELSDGGTVRYDRLLLATGARARPYPLLDHLGAGHLGSGVHTVRTLDDAEALRGHVWQGRRVLVVGGGVIGLEVAASMVSMGGSVTVIERGDRLMARAAPEPLARDLLALHERQGVAFAFGCELIEAGKAASGEITLACADGRRFTGDLVVYGVGVELNVELAVSAGLHVEDGIVVDEFGRTSHPDVFAAGDVARQWHPHLKAHIRYETWANAQNQGAGVARAMVLGEPCTFEVPWYWTDQYGINIQVAGSCEADDWLLRGDRAGGRYTLFGVTGGVVTGAVTVNNGRDMRPARALIEAGAPADSARLTDPKTPLRAAPARAA
ncbi:3-phenylpropionate/cinnamic acid dioxygenase ferredoxin--NAD(+) reductase subunit [Azospirillum sp. sgz302134]